MFDDNLSLSLRWKLCWPDWELFRVVQSVVSLRLQYQWQSVSSDLSSPTKMISLIFLCPFC